MDRGTTTVAARGWGIGFNKPREMVRTAPQAFEP